MPKRRCRCSWRTSETASPWFSHCFHASKAKTKAANTMRPESKAFQSLVTAASLPTRPLRRALRCGALDFLAKSASKLHQTCLAMDF